MFGLPFLPAEEEGSHRLTASAIEEEVGGSAGGRAGAGTLLSGCGEGLLECGGHLWGEGGVDGQGGFFRKFSLVL